MRRSLKVLILFFVNTTVLASLDYLFMVSWRGQEATSPVVLAALASIMAHLTDLWIEDYRDKKKK